MACADQTVFVSEGAPALTAESASLPRLLARARQGLFPSRKAPASTSVQARQVRDRTYDGSTSAMAAAYGVTPGTISRWISGTHRPAAHADRLLREVIEAQTTPHGRERRARQFEREGSVSRVAVRVSRARSFAIRGSDAIRGRDIYLRLTCEQAAALVHASTDDAVRQTIGEALADYFNGGASYRGFTSDDFSFDAVDFHLG
ncbi:putative terminal protein [Streptomyces sp. NBRC 110611]|nr:putative terminal protein [Streptomyces sp. NBRC 110611]